MNTNRLAVFFHTAAILGLVMLISPIVLVANSITPMIFGIPFLIAWVLFWWLFCTIIFLVAYLTNWGQERVRIRREEY